LRLVLTPGQASDQSAVPALLAGLRPAADTVADKAYDAKALVELITQHGSRPHIPTLRTRKKQRSVDPQLYRARNLVERFFNKLKHLRRIATRFDKLASNFLAATAIASARIWLRHNESTT
jgi:transposase